MAVLSMYSETVSDADIVLAEQEMTQVCDALQSQFYILRMDRDECAKEIIELRLSAGLESGLFV